MVKILQCVLPPGLLPLLPHHEQWHLSLPALSCTMPTRPALVPSYGKQNTCAASTVDDGKYDDGTQKVTHGNVDAGKKTAHYNPDTTQKMVNYNSDAVQKVAHYNVDACQKTRQNLEENCNSQAILKVKE